MPAELSLRLTAQEEISPATRSAAEGVKTLGDGVKRAAQEAKAAEGQLIRLEEAAHRMGGAARATASLSSEMAMAFGGARSEALQLVAGLVHGFAAGGPIGVGIAAASVLTSTFIEHLSEAGEKGEEAAGKGAAANRAEQTSIENKTSALKTYIDQIDRADARSQARLIGEARLELDTKADTIERLKAKDYEYYRDISNLKAKTQDEDTEKEIEKKEQERRENKFKVEAGLADLDASTRAFNKTRAELAKQEEIKALIDTETEKAEVRRKFAEEEKKKAPETIGSSTIYEIPEMDLEERGRAQVRAIAKGLRDEQEKVNKERLQQIKEAAQREAVGAAEKAREQLQDRKQFTQAGIQAGMEYLDAMGAAIRGDSRGALRSALSVIGHFLGIGIGMLVGGPGGAAIGGQLGGGLSNFAGGFLRDGGDALQVQIPKARRGIAFVDLDSDGKLIEGHAGEVMWNAGAVAKNGGIDRVARQNNPFEPPMDEGGGGGVTNVYLSTLVPQDAAAAVRRTIEPGIISNLSNRQSGLLQRQLQESARMPRHE